MDLMQHIERLLTENECVIVPGVGGFITCYGPARWVEKDNLFLPPGRMTGFNPRLTLNDGLLVQSYMAERHLPFAEASRLVAQEVEALVAQLHTAGSVDLPHIGRLQMSIRQTFEFTPSQPVTSAELYGFSSFHMSKLAPAEKLIPITPQVPEEKTTPVRRPAWRNAALWSNAAAVAAIIILFFAVSIPVKNTEIVNGNYAQLLPTEMFSNLSNQSLAITPVKGSEKEEPRKEETDKKEKKTEAQSMDAPKSAPAPAPPTQVQAPKVVEKSTPKKTERALDAAVSPRRATYYIIVASVGSENDAQTMAANLVKQGHARAKAIIGDGKMRVSIDSYPNEAEAYKAVAQLRQQEAYKNAWVLKKKE